MALILAVISSRKNPVQNDSVKMYMKNDCTRTDQLTVLGSGNETMLPKNAVETENTHDDLHFSVFSVLLTELGVFQ